MSKFEYVAKGKLGVETRAVVRADSTEAAVEALHRDGLIVISIREVGERMGAKIRGEFSGLSKRVAPTAVALATRQLATMVKAGLPLMRALHALSRDESNAKLSSVLKIVAEDIKAGETFSQALAKHPYAFSKFYISLIKSAEQSGNMDRILLQLAKYMERSESIKRKVRSAMAYPVFVLGFVILAGAVLFLKVVPMMAAVYDKLDAELPALTQFVIGVSDLMRTYLWVLLLIIAALLVTYRILKRVPTFQLNVDKRKLEVPIFGPIVKKLVIAKFLRTLGVLVDSGLPIMDSLELSGDSSGNEFLASSVKKVSADVSKGANLTSGFKKTGVFPEIVVQMVSTGEDTGSLGEMLSEVSDFYDEQVETAVGGLAAFIEPLMIVVVGAIVGLVVIATFMPVFGLSQAMKMG